MVDDGILAHSTAGGGTMYLYYSFTSNYDIQAVDINVNYSHQTHSVIEIWMNSIEISLLNANGEAISNTATTSTAPTTYSGYSYYNATFS